MKRARVKRASVEDLYKSCAQGGDCPPDVKNKVEGTTLADILLKVFGSIIYLGNLGIGSGRGSGGSLGYRPIGSTPSRPAVVGPTRPTVPIEPIGPPEVLPVDPSASSIVPLSEGLPDVAIIDTGGGGPGLPPETVDITTGLDPISEVTGIGEHPAITSNNDVAQIDVQINPPPPKRILLDASADTGTLDVSQSHASHVDSDYNVFVDAHFNSTHIGTPPEEIELSEISLREEFEIDEGPLRSTPASSRILSRARDLYHRFIQQVPTRTLQDVVQQPTRARLFEFENPAFYDDIADLFTQDVADAALSADSVPAAIRLGGIQLNETAEGLVRVSRPGQQMGITTRSGLQIGQRVHIYYDISPIPHEAYELRTLGEYSHESTVVDSLHESTFINPFELPREGSLFTDTDLADSLQEDFSNSHLLLTITDTVGETMDVPTLPPGIGLKVFVDDYASSIIPGSDVSQRSIIQPYFPFDGTVPLSPVIPSIPYVTSGSDFDLHPGFLLRRRKRKRSYY